MTKIILLIIINIFLLTSSKSQTNNDTLMSKDDIIEKYLTNGALKYRLYSREREEEIDKGLEKDSTIAYLWQQKAMPLFKQGKYELGMEYLDKAVLYKRHRWQGV